MALWVVIVIHIIGVEVYIFLVLFKLTVLSGVVNLHKPLDPEFRLHACRNVRHIDPPHVRYPT
jgi:hypothetical protein